MDGYVRCSLLPFKLERPPINIYTVPSLYRPRIYTCGSVQGHVESKKKDFQSKQACLVVVTRSECIGVRVCACRRVYVKK